MYDSEGGLYGWTPVDGNEYGIECFVWMGMGALCNLKSPFVIFTKEYREGCLEKSLIVHIENMDIVSNTENFGNEFKKIYEWVRLNQAVLINHWNGIKGYASSPELICALCPLENTDV